MSQEKTEYTQLLHDVAAAVGVQTKEPSDNFGRLPGREENRPDRHVRDDVMQRLGVLLDCERRLRSESDVHVGPDASRMDLGPHLRVGEV